MAGEGGDWYMGSKMVTTTCFLVTDGVKVGWALVHFSHQDWVSVDWFGQFTACQPFQCIIVSIMNGFASLRFEFIIHNRHHTPTFELWVGRGFWLKCPTFHTKMEHVWILIQEVHSIPTLPTSHCKYNEWLEKVETGIHPQQPSPHPGFWVAGVENFDNRPLHFTPRYLCTDWLGHFAASQPFQSLFISMMKG